MELTKKQIVIIVGVILIIFVIIKISEKKEHAGSNGIMTTTVSQPTPAPAKTQARSYAQTQALAQTQAKSQAPSQATNVPGTLTGTLIGDVIGNVTGDVIGNNSRLKIANNKLLLVDNTGNTIWESPTWKPIGCFADDAARTIPGGYTRVDVNYPHRACENLAKSKNHDLYAIQDRNACFTNAKYVPYNRKGTSPMCRNGTGGPYANDVYIYQ
jgi:hypothetical protein